MDAGLLRHSLMKSANGRHIATIAALDTYMQIDTIVDATINEEVAATIITRRITCKY